MKFTRFSLTALALFSLASLSLAGAEDAAALKLADEVMKAHGAVAWNQVKHVKFTFAVDLAATGEHIFEAKHDWLVRDGSDTVTWKGKTVKVDLFNEAAQAEGDAKAAFARWTNDSFWLIAPLQLRDKGVVLASGGKKSVEGKEYEVLEVSFDHVGLTPTDRYTLYIDPTTKRLVRWDYRPEGQPVVSSARDDHREFNGVWIAIKSPFMDKVIRFTDVSFER